MKNVTNTFKDDIRTYGRQLDFKIKVNGIDTDMDNFNYLKPAFHADLFKTVMYEIEIDSKNELENKAKINIEAGVKVNEPIYQYINYNTYTVNSCERQEDTLSYIVKAYDKMVESMIDYDLELSEKIKLREYLIIICQRLGWDISNIPATFINSEKLIDPNLHREIGYTFRDALDEIATLSCSFLLFIDDEFRMIYSTETEEIIDETYLDEDSITIGEKYFINSLVFSRAEESDNIYRKNDESIEINGLHEYRISDNQLLSTNDRDLYIDEMFNYLKTFEFYTFDVKTKGILFLEACDRFSFELSGKTYTTILLNDEINFDDGLTEDIYVDKPEETETDYKYADTTDKRINQAYILVDKQNQKITQLTQETTEHEEKITQVEQNVNGINSIVSNHTEKIEEVQEKTNLNTDEIARLGSTVTIEGAEIKVDASKNPAKIYIYGNSEQETNENSPGPDYPSEIHNVGENGSIDIKIQNKNLFSTDDIENAYITNAGEYISNKFNAMTPLLKVQKKKISARANTNILAMNFAEYDKNKNFLERHSVNNISKCTENITTNTEYIKFGLTLDNETEMTKEVLDSLEIQLEEGELTDYIKNEEQIIHFPLEEQVLHKDDYLAEDGIHHKRKTVVLDGTENFTYESAGRIFMVIHDIKDVGKVRTADILSSHFKINNTGEEKTAFHYQKLIYFFPNSDITSLIEWKAWLDEQYEAGTPVTIEYELANEEIVPYTPLQEDAMNSIYTFKGINYISCINSVKPKKLVLTYYPNTPYNETLVNKETFDKVTTDMNTEFNIRANEIETSVKESTTSSILTLLNNGYLTAEQVNALVNGNAEDIVTIKEQLKQTVTSSQMQIEITKAIDGGVSYLKNTLFTIDENGMAIATNQDEFNALYNNKGMYLYSYEEMIAKFDVNGATITGNLTLEGEFITQNLRMINTTVENVKHTHIHWIGG